MPVLLRPLAVAAYLTDRDPQVIRRWYLDGRLPTAACDVASRAVLVELHEVAALSAARGVRGPRRANLTAA